jgi:hypothetical protein
MAWGGKAESQIVKFFLRLPEAHHQESGRSSIFPHPHPREAYIPAAGVSDADVAMPAVFLTQKAMRSSMRGPRW